jgi:hypothetical protein
LDEIGIAVRQKGNESWGVQIPRADVASGPGVLSTGTNTNKGKGKAVTPVRSDEEVSSDDDHHLQRRRLPHNDGRLVGGLPPTRKKALMAVSTPLRGSVAVTSPVAAPGMSGVTNEAAVASRAAVEREVMDVVATKKDMNDAAAAERVATDAAAEEKAVEGGTMEAASRGVAESFPAPMARAERTVISGGSTPPAKCRFCGSWNPRYVVEHCICPFLYAYFVSHGFFIVQCVSFQQDTYPQS